MSYTNLPDLMGAKSFLMDKSMRDSIKQVATEMLIRHGYLGLRFQQISDSLGITRGNIHYHFGSKANLADEVIIDYTNATIESIKNIWYNRLISLDEKINRTMLFNKHRYLKFNPTEKTAHAWSLIARMRLERDVLPDTSQRALKDFYRELEESIMKGVQLSVENGELSPDAPIHDIAIHLVVLCSGSDPITQDAGTFERLVELYSGFSKIIRYAYGTQANTKRVLKV